MIKYLYLNNFVLFEEEKIEFSNNLNALVGDTGAGKSVIFSAINVLCGQRNIKKYIMKGKDYYRLGMLVDISNITKDNFNKINKIINIEGTKELIIYRKLTNNSKGVIKINSQEVSLLELREVMKHLIEIHFQNSTDEILKKENQINILDNLIDSSILDQYSELYKEYKNQEKKVSDLLKEDNNKEEALELLEFQINRLEKIKDIEDEEVLETKKKELENIGKVNEIDKYIDQGLNETYSKLGSLKQICEENKDLGYDKYLEVINNAYYEIENLSFEHSKNENNFLDDNIDDIIDKLSTLKGLKRKYNLDYEGLINKYEELILRKDLLENLSFSIVKEEKKLSEQYKELTDFASKISQKRKELAIAIEDKVQDNFQALNMVNAKLNIKIEEVPLNDKGLDSVNFMLKTNKGHDEQNIINIASGGEKSRIMLIFKMVINSFENKKIFLLDEIDQGVSSEVAKKIGAKLKEFSKDIQVLSISHTVQTINVANWLYEVKKDESKTISVSHVHKLTPEEKEQFINKYLEI